MTFIRLFCFFLTVFTVNAGHRRVCYYTNDGKLLPKQIDPSLCTHIIFGFAQISTNGTLVPGSPSDVTVFSQLNEIRKQVPTLKLSVSTGNKLLAKVSKTPESRKVFIKSIFVFLNNYGFDGIDFDWEFPGFSGRKNFVLLLKEIKEMGLILYRNGEKPLLSAAVSASLTIIIESYDIPQIAKYVDFVNIMCYDFNFFHDYYPFTGYNSPLFKRHTELPFFNTFNIEWATNYWARKGMPKEKIVVGLPVYGHTYILFNPKWHDVHDLAIGSGMYGGDLTYPQACDLLKAGATRAFDNESLVPYMYQDKNWISYEDDVSITYKAKWIVQQNFSGIMTWNLNNDDVNGHCNGTLFPLHKILRDIVE